MRKLYKIVCKIFGHKMARDNDVNVWGCYLWCKRCHGHFLEVDASEYKKWVMSTGE